MKLPHPKMAALALSLIAFSHPSYAFQDLSTTLQQATKNDPRWAATLHGHLANKELVHLSSAALKPTLSLNATTSQKSSDTDFSEKDDYTTNSVGAIITQPILRLDRWHTYKKGNAADKQIDANFIAEQQAFYMRVVKTYLDILRAEENLRFRKAEKSAIQRQLEQTEQRFNVGLIANTDVQEAKAAFDISSVQHIIAQQDLALTLQSLETLTGSPADSVAPLQSDVPITLPTPNNPRHWTDTALANNAELNAASHEKEAALEEYKIKRAAHLPTIDLEAIIQDGNSGAAFNGGDSTSSSISLKLNIPLYTGGSTSASRRQAKQLQLQAMDNYNVKRREVIQNTNNLYRVVSTDVSRVMAQKQSIRSAQAALEATEAGYQAGTRTIVDVLSVQQALYGAKRDYANARFDYLFDSLQLKQSAGILDIDDITEINNWLTR